MCLVEFQAVISSCYAVLESIVMDVFRNKHFFNKIVKAQKLLERVQVLFAVVFRIMWDIGSMHAGMQTNQESLLFFLISIKECVYERTGQNQATGDTAQITDFAQT